MTTKESRWEQVRDPKDRRRVVYWRYTTDDGRTWAGAVSRKSDGWRALGYSLRPGERPPNGNRELGIHATRRTAEREVLIHAGVLPPACATCGGELIWSEDAWACQSCGEEWCSDHGPEYVAPGDHVHPGQEAGEK